MVEEIRGEILSVEEKSIVVSVGGLGINVWTTQNVISQSTIGERAHLYTDLILRETDISLYGFVEKRNRNMFRTLIKVNGIGPKAAISILSTMTAEEIQMAVKSKNNSLFNQVPGIGNKTSQKLVLFLQDVFDSDLLPSFDPETYSVNSDLLDALVGLGYSIVEAQTCIQKIPEDTPQDLESRLRVALQYFT